MLGNKTSTAKTMDALLMDDSQSDKMKDLRQLMLQTLEKKGVLADMRASLRASVFTAIHEQKESESVPVSKELHNLRTSEYGAISVALVRDFLTVLNLKHTLSVFENEVGYSLESTVEEDISNAKTWKELSPPSKLSPDMLVSHLEVLQTSSNKGTFYVGDLSRPGVPLMVGLMASLSISNMAILPASHNDDEEEEEEKEEEAIEVEVKTSTEEEEVMKEVNPQQQPRLSRSALKKQETESTDTKVNRTPEDLSYQDGDDDDELEEDLSIGSAGLLNMSFDENGEPINMSGDIAALSADLSPVKKSHTNELKPSEEHEQEEGGEGSKWKVLRNSVNATASEKRSITRRTNKNQGGDGGKDQWHCSICKRANDQSATTCSICFTQRNYTPRDKDQLAKSSPTSSGEQLSNKDAAHALMAARLRSP